MVCSQRSDGLWLCASHGDISVEAGATSRQTTSLRLSVSERRRCLTGTVGLCSS